MIRRVCLVLLALCALACAAEREPIGHGAVFARRPAASCSGVKKKAIFAHPPWKGGQGRVIGQFAIHLNDAKAPALTFAMGIQDGHGSDKGVIYRTASAKSTTGRATTPQSGSSSPTP